MTAEPQTFTRNVETLVTNIRDLLDSSDPSARVRAVRCLAVGVELLERRVLHDAQASGMTWAEIGEAYGVSRQAAHRRFSDETVVPAKFFDTLLASLDEPPEKVPALARAGKRARRSAEKR